MDVREKLVELIANKECDYYSGVCEEWVEHDCEKCGLGNCSIAQLANHLIAHGVTVQEWISAKYRLPDTAERVLVCKTWNGIVYKPEYGYYQDYPNSKGCWYVLTEYGYYPQREVTHWMPLPQPPKGQ